MLFSKASLLLLLFLTRKVPYSTPRTKVEPNKCAISLVIKGYLHLQEFDHIYSLGFLQCPGARQGRQQHLGFQTCMQNGGVYQIPAKRSTCMWENTVAPCCRPRLCVHSQVLVCPLIGSQGLGQWSWRLWASQLLEEQTTELGRTGERREANKPHVKSLILIHQPWPNPPNLRSCFGLFFK